VLGELLHAAIRTSEEEKAKRMTQNNIGRNFARRGASNVGAVSRRRA
jgi:hypothetical protein